MYRGSNPSALRSRDEIVKAFLSLLSHTSLEQISIKMIMDSTGLSRQTFYQIFDSKEEVLEFYLDTIFEKFIEHYSQQTIGSLCDAAKLFFAFFGEYKEILGLIIQNGKSCVLQRKCREYLQRDSYFHYARNKAESQEEQKYAATFVISGMVAMLEQWLREEQPSIDTRQMALLVCRITGTKP
ncbi:TetR/AcrR family transcriptional regulator [Clostridium sp. AM58-1XD]|uniref:TetR/AcrR family transcriptional regulator n=1 Tax=Clostridium sp. AM58-1XD TaxID=2292307 RepID=UPI000E49F1FA|nr:TetR/AcrR family transcriptional regulator [Clostridium sp. AM58-1XD]RGY98383.1 TetR/AcrR family transcriptional regulator [Clostridium sp. AM58-1XD]